MTPRKIALTIRRRLDTDTRWCEQGAGRMGYVKNKNFQAADNMTQSMFNGSGESVEEKECVLVPVMCVGIPAVTTPCPVSSRRLSSSHAKVLPPQQEYSGRLLQ